jgi:hypothetical protein
MGEPVPDMFLYYRLPLTHPSGRHKAKVAATRAKITQSAVTIQV